MSLTAHDLLTRFSQALKSGGPTAEAVELLKSKADWDTLHTPKARLSQVETWCATIKPDLPKPLYKQLKTALRSAALPEHEAAPSAVKFRVNGSEVLLQREHVEARGGVLANYVGPYSEASVGTHTLQLGFAMTPDQLVHVANYISEGSLPDYLTTQQRQGLRYVGERLGIEDLVSAADSEAAAAARAKQQASRRWTLVDLGVEIPTTVDAAWAEAQKRLRLPADNLLRQVTTVTE